MNTAGKISLYPIKWIYQFVVALRNRLYDLKILNSRQTNTPTISIGNITVGGTGKTPHAEYLIEVLHEFGYRPAYLSRGYKRKSKGFVLASAQSTPEEIGDEAYQVLQHLPSTIIAVDKNRHNAARHLKHLNPAPDVIVLDDAYQHRSLTPHINILLINHNQSIFDDDYLPVGRLREDARNTDRADIIIITKCPETMQRVNILEFRTQISPFPYQTLYFTTFDYDAPRAIATGERLDVSGKELLVVTGIADPATLHTYLCTQSCTIHTMIYGDHHAFTLSDFDAIRSKFNTLDSTRRAIIITEKDFARTRLSNFPSDLLPHIYTINIKVKFLFDMEPEFKNQIKKMIVNKPIY